MSRATKHRPRRRMRAWLNEWGEGGEGAEVPIDYTIFGGNLSDCLIPPRGGAR